MTAEKGKKKIACVTGASGMVGNRIVHRLLQEGYIVRVLTRRKDFVLPGVDIHHGDICDEVVLKSFLSQSNLLFHCAAELKNESIMWEVNVGGTEKLLRLIPEVGIKYLCHISSVGVIGNTNLKLADELTPCNPQNAYEKSKWAAEQLVARGIQGCKTVILRPTNVVDEKNLGILSLPHRGSWLDFCKVFLTGGECAHIVHAEDVAEAAMHFIAYPSESPECYIVSYDDEPLGASSELWTLYNSFRTKKTFDTLRPIVHLPLLVPHVIRRIIRGKTNKGDVHYSSHKLMAAGFIFRLGLREAVRRIASASGCLAE